MPFIIHFLLGTVIVAIPLDLMRAWAIVVLYGWFARPLGAPAITVVNVYGLLLLLSLLLHGLKQDEAVGSGDGVIEAWWSTIWEMSKKVIAKTAAVLALGYVLHTWGMP